MVDSQPVAFTQIAGSSVKSSHAHRTSNEVAEGEHLREDQSQQHDNRESDRARVERMGREKPEMFKSLWAEVGFCYSILASQFMAVSDSYISSMAAIKVSLELNTDLCV